jgi:hypothetical protein
MHALATDKADTVDAADAVGAVDALDTVDMVDAAADAAADVAVDAAYLTSIIWRQIDCGRVIGLWRSKARIRRVIGAHRLPW